MIGDPERNVDHVVVLREEEDFVPVAEQFKERKAPFWSYYEFSTSKQTFRYQYLTT
jgi:hypothetical protein